MAEPPASTKPVHTIVLDAGPILKNVPPLSTLLAQAEELVTTPAVVREIRDPVARSRVETLYLPFLKQKTPSPNSVQVISEFARKTGDRAVLSKVDIEVLALAYEIECERNGGDWRLRSVPGQKRVNGKPPVKEGESSSENTTTEQPANAEASKETQGGEATETNKVADVDTVAEDLVQTTIDENKEQNAGVEEAAVEESTSNVGNTADGAPEEVQDGDNEEEVEEGEDSDGGGEWITPSNIKKKQARDESAGASATPESKVMQVATMTTDFAVSHVVSLRSSKILCAKYFPVSKRSFADEFESSVDDNIAKNSSPANICQALPRMLFNYKRYEQAILSSLRKRHFDASLMFH
jgi:RNA-binding protein NOB1